MNVTDLWEAARSRGMPARALLLVVEVGSQRLYTLDRGVSGAVYRVSTAARGLQTADGSGGTPPGYHLVTERYGGGEPPLCIFRSRRPAGLYVPGRHPASEDLILGRILRLSGLEPGVNQGPGRCSYERTIYLHGTQDTARIGRAVSGGCIRLHPDDIVELYEATRGRTTWCWVGHIKKAAV